LRELLKLANCGLAQGPNLVHTLTPTESLLTLALLGVVAGAILASFLPLASVVQAIRSVSGTAKDFSVVENGVQRGYTSAWQMLKNKSEVQISANDKSIKAFKAQRVEAGKAFRATYDKRVAELERRNFALKGKLKNHEGE
jgi:hypothetical protein